jgi:hypothetical protein
MHEGNTMSCPAREVGAGDKIGKNNFKTKAILANSPLSKVKDFPDFFRDY